MQITIKGKPKEIISFLTRIVAIKSPVDPNPIDEFEKEAPHKLEIELKGCGMGYPDV